MAPRQPSARLVVDANIILGAAFGSRSLPVFQQVLAQREVLTTSRVREEAVGRANDVREGSPRTRALTISIVGIVAVIGAAVYEPLPGDAGDGLRLAPASRNGSSTDAHLLALAWTVGADIWMHDRDFAGTGWPTWSSANLLAALLAEPSGS